MKQSVNQLDKQSGNQKKNDFPKGNVVGNITKLAVPMALAQLIDVLYNIVDRTYIGVMPENVALSLTGLGPYLPIISIVTVLTNLFSVDDTPLRSIERGRGNKKEAGVIIGNSFMMMMAVGILLTVPGLTFKGPMLYLFGASDAIISYADAYVIVYLMGNIFIMAGLGMNSFTSSQGSGTMGMVTVLLGAITNIVLDPILIFVFNMGMRGAALTTIPSQILPALWILAFLTGRWIILRLRPPAMRLDCDKLLRIVGLGMSRFIMSTTNSLVQIVYNSMPQRFSGGLYVGIIAVISSVGEVISMPVNGLTNSAQPVLGFNYGVREYRKVQKFIILISMVCILYTAVTWGSVGRFPALLIRIFSREGDMAEAGIPAIHMHFFGFFMISLQFAGQSVFMDLEKSRNAVFSSIFRKVIIVVLLIIILPTVFGMGIQGIPMIEPISNFIGEGACFETMLLTVWPKLKWGGEKIHSQRRKNQ